MSAAVRQGISHGTHCAVVIRCHVMPGADATDPADIRAQARAELCLSRELEQTRRRLRFWERMIVTMMRVVLATEGRKLGSVDENEVPVE